jgi:hypothetical protein
MLEQERPYRVRNRRRQHEVAELRAELRPPSRQDARAPDVRPEPDPAQHRRAVERTEQRRADRAALVVGEQKRAGVVVVRIVKRIVGSYPN